MIKIRFTWPMVFIALIALLIWLARDPSRPASKPRRRRRTMRGGQRPVIIDQPADSSDTYDDETERLDREAAEAGLHGRRQRPINPLRNKEPYRDRAAAR